VEVAVVQVLPPAVYVQEVYLLEAAPLLGADVREGV